MPAPVASAAGSPAGSHVHTWRVATIARAFVLMLAAAELALAGAPAVVSLALGVLALAAAGFCLLERQPGPGSAWAPPAEGFLVAVLVNLTGDLLQPLLVCLALPAVVAGIQRGQRAVAGTTAVTVGALLLVGQFASPGTGERSSLAPAVPWLVLGLGAGLLAAVQSKPARDATAVQASYAAAHGLVDQLHSLVRRQSIDLDPPSLARVLVDDVRQMTKATHCAVWAQTTDAATELLAAVGSRGPHDQAIADRCISAQQVVRSDVTAAVPLRVAGHTFGAVVLTSKVQVGTTELNELRTQVDRHAVRLDTALLIEGIRSEATSEERRRLARDIHDGVAQRVVALGYLVDEVLETAADPDAQVAAAQLRTELSTVVGELRSSVYDLRLEIGSGGITPALSGYVQEVSRRTSLRVHLSLDERGPRPPQRVEAEVFRIAQEAISNVDRHAHAVNLWVSYSTDGHGVRLDVEDDGVGCAGVRPGHFGMHTMQERAARIGAQLSIAQRDDGGTVVGLRKWPAGQMPADEPMGESNDDICPAR